LLFNRLSCKNNLARGRIETLPKWHKSGQKKPELAAVNQKVGAKFRYQVFWRAFLVSRINSKQESRNRHPGRT
jgi:hypothetical protein